MPALTTPVCDFGISALNFCLPDCFGKPMTLAECFGDPVSSKGFLIMFICNHCPYVQAMLPELIATTKILKTAGVNTVAIMSNDWQAYPDDSPVKMRDLVTQCGIDFPYLVDETQDIARQYGAVCTPDFFGYNNKLELQYRGRFDDRGRNRPIDNSTQKQNELERAMLQITKTGKGPAEQKPSIGCSIKWRA